MKRLAIVAIGLCALAGEVRAAVDPAYRPSRLPPEVATYRNRHDVGPILFRIGFSVANPGTAAITRLTFRQGQLPEWWGRAYFPCTLKEACDALPGTVHNPYVQVSLHYDGRDTGKGLITLDSFDVGAAERRWNACTVPGGPAGDCLATFPVGSHTVTVRCELVVEYPPLRRGTSGEARFIRLAESPLMVDVTP